LSSRPWRGYAGTKLVQNTDAMLLLTLSTLYLTGKTDGGEWVVITTSRLWRKVQSLRVVYGTGTRMSWRSRGCAFELASITPIKLSCVGTCFLFIERLNSPYAAPLTVLSSHPTTLRIAIPPLPTLPTKGTIRMWRLPSLSDFVPAPLGLLFLPGFV
jgi:hypothetical protein